MYDVILKTTYNQERRKKIADLNNIYTLAVDLKNPH